MTVQLPSSYERAEQAALAVLNAATDQMPKPAEGASAEAIARAEVEANAFLPTYSLPRSLEPPLRTSRERAERTAEAEAKAVEEAEAKAKKLAEAKKPAVEEAEEKAKKPAEAKKPAVEEAEAEAAEAEAAEAEAAEAEAAEAAEAAESESEAEAEAEAEYLREKATVERALELVELAKTRPLSDAEAAEAEALTQAITS